MEVKRWRTVAIEILKAINNINLWNFMEYIFNARKTSKSLRALSRKIWNQLPTEIKSETSYLRFKDYIKTLFGPE